MGVPPRIGNGGSGGEKALVVASDWKAWDWAVRSPVVGRQGKDSWPKINGGR
jgi:hypothetical protein